MFGTFALRAGVALIWHCVARLDGLVAGDAAALCVAGVALMAIYLRFAWPGWHLYGTAWHAWTAWSPVTPRHFAWHAWHLVTATFVLRGRRGTWRHPPSFHHVAGVGLGDIQLRFAWQAWHLWQCVARLDGLVAGDAAALCVAGVALMAIYLRFAWPGWHLYGTAWHAWTAWSPVTPRHFAWQAWHLVTATFVLRGRRGTWRHPPSFHHVAGVALGDIQLRFAWQAWHLWHCVARLDGLVAGDAAAFCVAGVALMAIYLRFAWQAWHGGATLFLSGGRRGAWSHASSFAVAGVAVMTGRKSRLRRFGPKQKRPEQKITRSSAMQHAGHFFFQHV